MSGAGYLAASQRLLEWSIFCCGLRRQRRATKREAGFPSPLEPSIAPPVQQDPADNLDPPFYSAAASVAGITDTKVRPLAFARNSTRPSTLAKRVWSVPMPTLRPGCQVVPR